MIAEVQRQVLREGAIAAWERSKQLQVLTGESIAHSREAVRRYAEPSCHPSGPQVKASRPDPVRGSGQWPGSLGGAVPAMPPHVSSRAVVLAKVDQAIRRMNGHGAIWSREEASGVGLAASADFPMLVRLDKALDTLGRVENAYDAATALGVAIVTQPDVALIDARLDLAKGSDLALLLRLYAPRTRTLVLTESRSLKEGAASREIDALSRRCSDRQLRDWVAKVGLAA